MFDSTEVNCHTLQKYVLCAKMYRNLLKNYFIPRLLPRVANFVLFIEVYYRCIFIQFIVFPSNASLFILCYILLPVAMNVMVMMAYCCLIYGTRMYGTKN
jgi:hypothetical protein